MSHQTIVRHENVQWLVAVCVALTARGFSVSPVQLPANLWTHGTPYFSTNAPMIEVWEVRQQTPREPYTEPAVDFFVAHCNARAGSV